MQKSWIISVNMGYGHQRTAFPLREMGEIINANDYHGIPTEDGRIWETTRKGYEFISILKRIPLIGDFIFFLFDQFQRIFSFYPKRDLIKPNFQLKQTFSLIKNGWGKDLIHQLGSESLPLISTFFTPAFMAEYFNYPGQIFLVVCDADISRAWASVNPGSSKIKYFAPNERVVERLKLYGVKPENIFLTGYPLPLENIGTEKLEILKRDLSFRLLNLDPKKRFSRHYEPLIEKHLGGLPKETDHPLTIMFAVGGAGAQKEIGIKMVKSLAVKVWAGDVKVILVAGIRKRVKEYFERNLEKLKLGNHLGAEIIFEKDINSYFQKFNLALRKTDILWTKPSELSFYSALGLPIIVAPAIGSQEEFNKRWLLKSGFGMLQENPGYVSQWLFDWISQGYLAEAAFEGFIEGEKLGTFKIAQTISAQRFN